jgi:hypothetical protein
MDPRRALTILTRLAARRPEQEAYLTQALEGRLEELAKMAMEVAVVTGDLIGKTLAAKVADDGGEKLALQLVRRCESDFFSSSVPLREVALAAIQKSVAFLRTGRRDLPTRMRQEQMAFLSNLLAGRLGVLGRHEEAVLLHFLWTV